MGEKIRLQAGDWTTDRGGKEPARKAEPPEALKQKGKKQAG